MTNEELVALIQTGNREKLPELWAQVERLVRKKAYNWARAFEGRNGATFDDFAQAGFLGFVVAVESFTPDRGASFANWLCICIKNPFTEVAGIRTAKQRNEPLHRAGSLDEPLGNDEDNSLLGEVIEDPQAESRFLEVEAQELHDALEDALNALPGEQLTVIRARYYRNLTLDQIAAELGRNINYTKKLHDDALRKLRHPAQSRRLKTFMG